VNDSTEATHYQIELTSRQVLAALVVLLVCLFAAFFSGVWIGRNAEADSAAHQLARVDEMSRGGERFDFFSKTRPDSSELPSSPAGPAIDQGDFGPDPDDAELDSPEGDRASMTDADPDALFEGDDAAAQAGDEPAPPEEMGRGGRRRKAERAPEGANVAAAEEETAAATESPAASGGTPGTAADAPPVVAGKPADATPAADAAKQAAAAAESAPPAPTGDGPGFHIQVLATSDRDKAEALVARLVDADFKAFIVPSNEGGRTVYRVRVGPFDDRTIAAGKAEELESRWGLDSWISPGAP
jgi:cell division septation protein DedD